MAAVCDDSSEMIMKPQKFPQATEEAELGISMTSRHLPFFLFFMDQANVSQNSIKFLEDKI